MTTRKISFVISRDSVGFQLDGNPVTISKTHMNYHNIVAVLETGDIEAVRPLLVPIKQAIADSSDGSITFDADKLWFEGEELHNAMVPIIIGLIRDGLSVQPLTNFLRNALENPSARAREEMYGFVEAGNMPVTPDGYFIAYKMVQDDFTDIRTGSMDNSPGAVVKMKRADVDPNKNQTCSHGLHFAALEYVVNGSYGCRDFGHRLVALKINPRDVVAIPADYNNSKGRACQYLVLRELDWDSRLPVNIVGFNLFDGEDAADDNEAAAAATGEDILTLTPSGAIQTIGKRLWPEAAVIEAKRLLAEPDSSLTGVSKTTGMSRRLLARIRDGQAYADILI